MISHARFRQTGIGRLLTFAIPLAREEVIMRIFDLFLRRAGVDRPGTLAGRRASSRLTVVCSREALGAVRKQICLDFKAAGLNVAQMQVDQGHDKTMASTCITVNCPADMRKVLMTQAKQLSDNPAIRSVRFGDQRPALA
jgi:hypothetical protein